MALTTELWEDTGPLDSNNNPTTRIEVDNIGWKDSPKDETVNPANYPIVRPYYGFGSIYNLSYKKYNYVKIYGTYNDVQNVRCFFKNRPKTDGTVRMYYMWTTEYQEPDNLLLNGSWFDPTNSPTWYPLLSTSGPRGPADWVPQLTNDTTYYTKYLVTQLYIEPASMDNYGNLDTDFEFRVEYEEYKTGLPGYDQSLVNWSW